MLSALKIDWRPSTSAKFIISDSSRHGRGATLPARQFLSFPAVSADRFSKLNKLLTRRTERKATSASTSLLERISTLPWTETPSPVRRRLRSSWSWADGHAGTVSSLGIVGESFQQRTSDHAQTNE